MYERVKDTDTQAVFGDYQMVDHDHDVRAADPTARAGVALGNLRSMLAVEPRGSIGVVRTDMGRTMVELIQSSSAPKPRRVGPYATEILAVPGPGSNWIDALSSRGYAVLINVPESRNNVALLLVVTSPEQVAQMAYAGAPYAVLAAPVGYVERAATMASPLVGRRVG